MLEWLTELRKTIHSLHYQLVTKGSKGSQSIEETTGGDPELGPRGAGGLARPRMPVFWVPTWKFPEARPSEVLQMLYYTGAVDELIGHWQLIQPPAPPPSLEVRR